MLELLNQEVVVPQWYLAAIGLASVVVSLVVFSTASYISYRQALSKVARSAVVDSHLKPQPKSTRTYRPVPPIRQRYWYYVSGVQGRFATLREALSASGVKVATGRALDWKKLSPDTRAKLQRVKVDDEQPSEKQQSSRGRQLPPDEQPLATPADEWMPSARRSARRESEQEEGVIRKSIGSGAFVTIRKKGK